MKRYYNKIKNMNLNKKVSTPIACVSIVLSIIIFIGIVESLKMWTEGTQAGLNKAQADIMDSLFKEAANLKK